MHDEEEQRIVEIFQSLGKAQLKNEGAHVATKPQVVDT